MSLYSARFAPRASCTLLRVLIISKSALVPRRNAAANAIIASASSFSTAANSCSLGAIYFFSLTSACSFERSCPLRVQPNRRMWESVREVDNLVWNEHAQARTYLDGEQRVDGGNEHDGYS